MSLHSLFAPRSIAVIGASTTPGSVGNDVAKNLVESDFTGTIHLVNPKVQTLFGQVCYPSVDAVPGTIDLVIIIVPAKIVPAVLREAGERLVRAAVIISSGFKESGAAGAALEAEVVHIAEEFHMAILGPNCLGFINPSQYLNASFASTIPAKGSIAFFSQSGALTSAFLDLTHGKFGFSLFASIGNKAVTDEKALLEYLFQDEGTKTIGMYTENLEGATRFIALGRENLAAKNPKPIVALKSGTTAAGGSASSSHTGAVAGSDAAYDALFRQARMFRAKNFEELMDLLLVLDQNPVPRGNRVAIITNAGGLGVLATDAAIKNGLELATLSDETIRALQAVLPPAANTHNPIDVLGDALADRYAKALDIVARDDGVDLVLVILTPQTMTEAEKTAEKIVKLRKSAPALPIVTVFSGARLVHTGQRLLEKAGIPNLLYPETGARTLGLLARFGIWQRGLRSETPATFSVDTARARQVLALAESAGQFQLGERPATDFLSAYGFPFLKSRLVTTREEAAAFASELGTPLALKISSPDIIHKSDVGGVLLNVRTEETDVAYEHLLATVRVHAPDARIDGTVAVEMAATGGREILLGLKKEPGLGTLVVVGLGGIHVETFKDIAMRFAPLLPSDIDAMLDELKSLPLLLGSRGEAGIDLATLKEYIARLSQVAVDFPEIEELDINPILAFSKGSAFRILDSRIRIAEK
ncbi:MAG: acetate--CoA ligase family protein [Candidatus Moraniibacteriota bacterium]